MRKVIILLIFLVAGGLSSTAQKNFIISPLIQQCGMYYSSDRVTSDGVGLGLGVHVLHKTGIAAQMDVSLLWLNGNSCPVRFAAGYQKKGKWSPGVYATINAILGQRTEVLTESGSKPPVPSWAFGIRITPLNFITGIGYISALEVGIGTGPYHALDIELTLFSAGISF
jgi:hypothetical protein